MELFEKVYNNYYRQLHKIINDIQMKKISYTKKDIEQTLNKSYKQSYPSYDKLIGIKKIEIFQEKSDKTYTIKIQQKIPYILDKLEKYYLNIMLQDSKIENHLEERQIKKLKKLMNTPSNQLQIDKIWIKRNVENIEQQYISHTLSQIKKAITTKSIIKYDNTAKDGTIYKDHYAYPYKIEYSKRKDTYSLIALIYDNKNKVYRVININIASIKNIAISENTQKDKDELFNHTIQELQEKIKEFYKEKYQEETPLKLQVKNVNNAIERCFQIFSYYDKEAIYDSEKDIYILTVYYYKFEESQIIKDILYLGSAVIVLSPQEIQDKIVSTLKKSL